MAAVEGCSEWSNTVGEPLWGTAAAAKRVLLVSWPKKTWASEAASSPGLPVAIQDWATAQADQGVKAAVRLIWRAEERENQGLRLFLWPDQLQVGPIPVSDASAALQDPTREGGWIAWSEPILAVCTHGKHDACCARHGQGVYEALKQAAAEKWPQLQVWEASHLGGHRFAATALSLPGGQMWGRLRASDARCLVEHLANDTVWVSRYRGRIDLAPALQIAEAYGHDRLHGQPGGVSVMADGEFAALVRTELNGQPPQWFRVTSEFASFAGGTSCAELQAPGARWTRLALATASQAEAPT